jgi:hypothetical protein
MVICWSSSCSGFELVRLSCQCVEREGDAREDRDERGGHASQEKM